MEALQKKIGCSPQKMKEYYLINLITNSTLITKKNI